MTLQPGKHQQIKILGWLAKRPGHLRQPAPLKALKQNQQKAFNRTSQGKFSNLDVSRTKRLTSRSFGGPRQGGRRRRPTQRSPVFVGVRLSAMQISNQRQHRFHHLFLTRTHPGPSTTTPANNIRPHPQPLPQPRLHTMTRSRGLSASLPTSRPKGTNGRERLNLPRREK